MALLEKLNWNKKFIYLSSTNIELKWLASVPWRINFFAICQSQNIVASNFGSGFGKSRSVSGGHNFNVDSHFGLIKIIFSIDEKTKKIRENVAWKMMRTKPATAVRLNTVE